MTVNESKALKKGTRSLVETNWKTLASVTAYHSGGEAEHPTIRRLTPSCRHQLSRIVPPSNATNSRRLTVRSAVEGHTCLVETGRMAERRRLEALRERVM